MDTVIGSLDSCKPSNNNTGNPPQNGTSSIQDTHCPSHAIGLPEATLGLNNIGCCDELNAGYVADGYARSRGVGACVVTFTVGGLSIINATAEAYSENLLVICIVGGPNTNDYGTNRILHHTIGLPDFSQELRLSNKMGLEAAVEATAAFLNKAVKPVIVGGSKLRVAKACDALVEFADAYGYPLAVMPSAKELVPEHHPHFIGTYWGAVSTPFCSEIVESADAYIFVGPIFNDYSSVGYSLLLEKEKAIIVQPHRVVVASGPAFGCVLMKDFLPALAKRLHRNTTASENYSRIYSSEGLHNDKDTAVIAETGDSWFNCQKRKLPQGCGYEFQMQYGSIGWSVGATLSYAQSVPDKPVIACIGDGSFQRSYYVHVETVLGNIRCIKLIEFREELLEWGSRISAANARPPNPQ
ncbi:unnamed protein product [Dovyalis caffra]|uniref:pyruvate decarboxylase n=1 Tax=Dovyalis caffra TaxID=77055 RepID=A0AAV1R8B3_9ROSI|nr:unnamed protein product [Dovyalis caffra]